MATVQVDPWIKNFIQPFLEEDEDWFMENSPLG